MEITFLGASGTVTGSSYLLTNKKKENILIDCGMFQGIEGEDTLNSQPFPFSTIALEGVFVTHAHLDHCGRLPLLIKSGFNGKIYTTQATKDIMEISLMDAASIQEEEGKEEKKPILYTKEDVLELIKKVEIVQYDNSIQLGTYTITFRNAGHILGSASIEISSDSHTIIFSGDLGNSPERLIQPTEQIKKADTVIMESTYGNTTHSQENAHDTLLKEITAIENSGGVLLIPAFSIERTQEILHILSHLFEEKKISSDMPVFLDSPMAISVTEVFKKYTRLYSTELSHDKNPFNFPSLVCTPTTKESKAILDAYSPKIIIAGSGMMSGGRILHHLHNYLASPTTRVLIVGYQAVGTLGRILEEGAKNVHIYHDEIEVKATITKMEAFSSHADQPILLSWLKNIQNVEKVFLVHGEDKQRNQLSTAIKEQLHISQVFLPKKGATYEIN